MLKEHCSSGMYQCYVCFAKKQQSSSVEYLNHSEYVPTGAKNTGAQEQCALEESVHITTDMADPSPSGHVVTDPSHDVEDIRVNNSLRCRF